MPENLLVGVEIFQHHIRDFTNHQGKDHGHSNNNSLRDVRVLDRLPLNRSRIIDLAEVCIMKTGKSQQADARYLCKVYLDRWTHRLIWWAFRRFLLNEDYWKVHMLFSGPRTTSFNASYCLKANAVARRVYIETRRQPERATNFELHLVDKIKYPEMGPVRAMDSRQVGKGGAVN